MLGEALGRVPEGAAEYKIPVVREPSANLSQEAQSLETEAAVTPEAVNGLGTRLMERAYDLVDRAYGGLKRLPAAFREYRDQADRNYRLGILELPEVDLDLERDIRVYRLKNLEADIGTEFEPEKIERMQHRLAQQQEELQRIYAIQAERLPMQEEIADRIETSDEQ